MERKWLGEVFSWEEEGKGILLSLRVFFPSSSKYNLSGENKRENYANGQKCPRQSYCVRATAHCFLFFFFFFKFFSNPL